MTHSTTEIESVIGNQDEARERLIELAKKIEAHRVAHEIPKEQMPKRFADYLKSYRGIERAVAGDTSEMNVEKQLVACESIWSLINTPPPRPKLRAYDDTTLALQLRSAFVRTMRKTGPNRVILLIAPSGRGKSEALKALEQTYKRPRIIRVEASRVWKDNPLALLKAIWKQLGKAGNIGNGPEALVNMVDALNESRICVCIDEAHYLGPEQLNTVTNLVNSTQGEFVLAGQPTFWERLERSKGAYLEARQLTGNRLSRRITAGVLNQDTAGDLQLMMERRAPWLNGSLHKAVTLLLKHAPQHGNLAFARNVIERVEEAKEEGGAEDWPTFVAAVEAELQER